MKVISFNDNTTSNFAVHLTFETNEYYTSTLGGEILEVADWVSNTFSDKFVLLEYATKIIAGGCVDNALAWAEKWRDDEVYNRTDKYQLRGSAADITLFLLKFNNGNTQ